MGTRDRGSPRLPELGSGRGAPCGGAFANDGCEPGLGVRLWTRVCPRPLRVPPHACPHTRAASPRHTRVPTRLGVSHRRVATRGVHVRVPPPRVCARAEGVRTHPGQA